MIKDALNITNEITKLVKASPKREEWLESLKRSDSDIIGETPGKIQRLSFTRYSFRLFSIHIHLYLLAQPDRCEAHCFRWTVRASTMRRVLDNYFKLMELFSLVERDSSTDSDVATKVAGVLSKMQKHSFLFGKFSAQCPFLCCY